jgi:hypothetical protein
VDKELEITKVRLLWLRPLVAFAVGLALITGGLVLGASQDNAREPAIQQELVFAPSAEDNEAAGASSDSDRAETVACPEDNSESEQCLPESPSEGEVESNESAEAESDLSGQAQDSTDENSAGSQQTDWVVPELLGVNVNEATQALKLLGFTNVELVEFADRKPRSTVVYSSIKAGSRPNKSQKVTLGFVRYSYSSSDLLFEWRPDATEIGAQRDPFFDGTDTPMCDIGYDFSSCHVARDYASSLNSPITCVSFKPFGVRLPAPAILHLQAETACRAAGFRTRWPNPILATLYTLNPSLALKTAITKNY